MLICVAIYIMSRMAKGRHAREQLKMLEQALMQVFCRSANVEQVLRLPRPRQNWAGQRARRQVVYVLKAKNASQKNRC